MGVRSLPEWRETEGMGVRSSVAGNAPGGSRVCLGSEEPLLSSAQGVGPLSWTLYTHVSPCLHGYWEGHPPEQACAPVCCQLLMAPASTGTRGGSHWSKHTRPSHGRLNPLLPERAHVSVTASCWPLTLRVLEKDPIKVSTHAPVVALFSLSRLSEPPHPS